MDPYHDPREMPAQPQDQPAGQGSGQPPLGGPGAPPPWQPPGPAQARKRPGSGAPGSGAPGNGAPGRHSPSANGAPSGPAAPPGRHSPSANGAPGGPAAPPKPPAPKLPTPPKKKKPWLPFAVIGGVLLLAGAGVALALALLRGGVGLVPSAETEAGIPPDATFTLTLNQPAEDLDALAASITFEPDTPFTLTPKGGDGTAFTLTPNKLFAPGIALTVTVGEWRPFTYTVQNRLMLAGTFPANGGQRVPTTSGVEFNFNAADIDMLTFRVGFSITPPVAGGFEAAEGRYVFYPAEPMRPGTEYTVALSDDVRTQGGATLDGPVGFTFTTQTEEDANSGYTQRQFQMYGNGFSVNALTSEAPVYLAYLAPELTQQAEAEGGGTVAVAVHAFASGEDYADRLAENLGRGDDVAVKIDTSGLTQVAGFTLTPTLASPGSEEYYFQGRYILAFPEPLPKGWYAVQLTYSGGGASVTRQQFLQVSDTSVFTMWSGKNMLAWVNSAADGQPVQGAEVSLSGGFNGSATTGKDGVATLATGSPPVTKLGGRYGDLITVKHGEDLFVDLDNYYYYTYSQDTPSARAYISTLFCDRPVYRTTDTLHAWGVVRPRDEALTGRPAKARLVLSDYQATLAEAEVTIGADGTYTAELPFTGIASSWCTVQLMLEDTVLVSQSATVEDFQKPVYTAAAQTDKPIYLLGADSTATLSLDVTMFDGTPAPGIPMGLYVGGGLEVTAADEATDARGHLAVSLNLWDTANTWYPQSRHYSFNTLSAESENLYVGGSVTVVNRDLMLRGAPVKGSGGTSAEVTTHAVNVAGLTPASTSYGYNYFTAEQLQGAPLSTSVNYDVHRVYYTKEVTGTYYDFISRTTAETYTWHRHDEIVDFGRFTTAGGTYTLEGLPAPADGSSYYLALTAMDTRGRPVESKVWLGRELLYAGYNNDGYQRYTLMKRPDPARGAPTEQNGDTLFYSANTQFEDGEDLSFYLAKNDEELTQMPGRLLTTLVKDTFSHTAVGQAPGLELPFDEKLLPNYTLTGAYFDGKRVFPLENTAMRFDPAARALDIALTTDKAAYAPAEQASVSAAVTLRESGAPAAGVAMVLAVVDEAVFAIQEQYVDILNQYYRQMYYPEVFKYTSYPQPFSGAAGEKGGGGGGGSLRTDFRDTAQFLTATTDANGTATFRFKLPDNITKWRLTALAVGPQGTAGNSTGAAIATRPFFVAPVVNATLLAGDSCAVGLYGAGTAVGAEAETEYTVTLQGNGVAETLTAASPLRNYASVDFGPLPAGSYTVTVAGACAGYQDAVRLPITVQNSGVEVSAVAAFDLAQGLDIDPLRQPVGVVFYGEGGRATGSLLSALARASAGSRADMRLARVYLARLMEQSGTWYDAAALEQDIADLDGRQLLQLYPYSGADLALTVQAHLAAPQLVGGEFLDAIFAPGYTGYYTTTGPMGHLARVLAGQPLGANLPALAADIAQGLADRLTLALAIAAGGDTATAQALYDELVTPNLVATTGVSGQTLLAMPADMYCSENQNTAAASWLATMLKTPEAEGLVLQLAEKGSEYEPYLLEQMYYLTTFGPGGSSKAAFTYNRGGVPVTQAVDGAPVSLSFTLEELAQADFSVTQGPVYADVYYTASPADLREEGRLIGLTKTVTPVDGTTGPGALVRITLTPDFTGLDTGVGTRTLLIDDYIPSGLRFEKAPYGSAGMGFGADAASSGWALVSRQGQRLQFSVYGLLTGSGVGVGVDPIVYYARVSTPGDYIVESAYISSASGESWGASERDVFHAEG